MSAGWERKRYYIFSGLQFEGDWLGCTTGGERRREEPPETEIIQWRRQDGLSSVRGHHPTELGEIHLPVPVYIRLWEKLSTFVISLDSFVLFTKNYEMFRFWNEMTALLISSLVIPKIIIIYHLYLNKWPGCKQIRIWLNIWPVLKSVRLTCS